MPNTHRAVIFLLATAALGLPAALAAQDKPAPPPAAAAPVVEPAVGMTVFGPGEVEAAKIESIAGDQITLFTGTERATVGRSDLRQGPSGLRIGMTREQLNEAVQKSKAAKASGVDGFLKVDAEVRASDGTTVLGVVRELIDDDFVLRADERSIILSKALLKSDDKGLMLEMSAADFKAQTGSR